MSPRAAARLETLGFTQVFDYAAGKAARPHLKRLRRPAGLKVDCPGVLVQLDSKQVQLGNGKIVFQFGALDCFTRKRVVALAPRLTSREGAAFLEKIIATLPFPLRALQSDGGSEFLGEFGKTVSELKLVHYFNRPNYPQGNGRVERSFRTDDEEFYHVQELPADRGGLEAALLAWNHIYENIRPHQALGYRTPEQFYQHWLATQNHRKEVALSDMSGPSTEG